MTHELSQQQDALPQLYEQDYYRWLEQTALLLRQRAFSQINLEYLIAEIEDMGRSEKRAMESNLRVILLHLLKWKYQPLSETNGKLGKQSQVTGGK